MKWFPRIFSRGPAQPANPSAPVQAKAAPITLDQIIRPEAQMRWLTPRLAQITPDYIENLLRGALGGGHVHQWELFDLMEDTWPRLAKNLNEVKRAVSRLDWKVDPWSEDDAAPTPEAEERAKFVSNAIWRMRPATDRDENAFEGTVYDLLDAWGKGTSLLEILWNGEENQIMPRATVWVHPTNYAWHQEGWLGLRLHPDVGNGIFRTGSSYASELIPLPEDKFLVALCKARTAHASAAALLRPLAWWWCASNFSASWLLNFAQIFGLPIRWATYDTSQPGILSRISAMLENMGSTAWAAFPQGTTLELKEASKSGGGADSPQGNLLDRADKQCDLLILGQTLTTDVGSSGSLALGEVHSDVRSDIILAAADFIAGILNRQLIPSILRLNYGDDNEAPEICAGPNKIEDARANAERDQLLIAAGIEIPKAWFYERHNIPLPQPGEETIKGQSQPQQPFPGDPNQPQRFPQPGQDPDENEKPKDPEDEEEEDSTQVQAKQGNPLPDQTFRAIVADAAGARAKWLEPVSQEMDRLAALARKGNISDEELAKFLEKAIERLPDLFADLDKSAFIERIEAGLGAAALAGAADALEHTE